MRSTVYQTGFGRLCVVEYVLVDGYVPQVIFFCVVDFVLSIICKSKIVD